MLTLKRLAIGAGSAALVFGAAVPLTAHAATGPIPDQSNAVCSTDLGPSPASAAGEGMIVSGATNGPDITCSYVSTAGKTTNVVVQSLNAWEITDSTGKVLASQGNVTNGGSPNPQSSFTAPGGKITLTVHAATDSNTGLGGASANAVVGGQ
jgi:hypothetical protein